MMNYSQKQIDTLSAALKGDVKALDWLISEAKELASLEGAIRGEKRPMEWLLKNNKLLAAFVDAAEGNNSAVRFLMKKKEYAWAAVANLLNEDENAGAWLKKQHLEYYIKLAESIKFAWEKGGNAAEAVFRPFGS